MSAAAVRPESPPAELADRTEGWGVYGNIYLYPSYRDTGTWPANVEGHTLVDEQPETSDTRDDGWFRDGEVID